VDLFSKKYLFIPICEAEHWSLAVICYPGNLTKVLDEHI
jgi:Ulp1 family protease